MALPGTESEPD